MSHAHIAQFTLARPTIAVLQVRREQVPPAVRATSINKPLPKTPTICRIKTIHLARYTQPRSENSRNTQTARQKLYTN